MTKAIHKVALAVYTPQGEIKAQGKARWQLKQNKWPDRPFMDNKPYCPKPADFPAKYSQHYELDPEPHLVTVINPEWEAMYQEAQVAVQEWKDALRAEYDGYKLIIMGYNYKDGWFVLEDQDDDRWWDMFVNTTILIDNNDYILKRLTK